jgi:predicted DNA-binding transcriptional regulator AlpA
LDLLLLLKEGVRPVSPKKLPIPIPQVVANVAAVTGDRCPPRLIDKIEVLRRVPFTYPIIWRWMREGTFPPSRDTGGKTTWVEEEINQWIMSRPVKTLKGDDEKIGAVGSEP